jgi:MFS superfamily sulfate permease-like transporter
MFNPSHIKYDLRASLVVFLVALPLCLGIALASGAPLASGLIAGIIGGIVVGGISGSHISVSGPAAGLTVIVATAISQFGSFEIFALSVFFAGLLQIAFSFINGGSIGNYFPTSVIKGMLAAIGLILILKQFPHAVGYDADFMGDESFFQGDGQNTFSEILSAIQATHAGSIVIAMLSMLIMIGWDKGAKAGKAVMQLIPGALIAVVTSILLNEFFKWSNPALIIEAKHLVQLPFAGGFSDFLAGFRAPAWESIGNVKVYVTAFVIALVASLESLLSIEAADKIDEAGRVTSKNRELLAQGVGNTLCGLFGGLPVTAVIVRTSANATAGAKSKLSAVMHGIWLIAAIVIIPQVLNLIPLSCLAAVLILVGYKLTKPDIIMKMYQKGWNQFVPFMVTILAILFTDLLVGIIIGMGVGFFFVLRSSIHKAIVMVNDGDQFLIRFHKDVSFLQKTALLKMFDQIPENASVIIDGSRGVYVDDDITDLIEDYIKRAGTNKIFVELKKSSLSLSAIFKE